MRFKAKLNKIIEINLAHELSPNQATLFLLSEFCQTPCGLLARSIFCFACFCQTDRRLFAGSFFLLNHFPRQPVSVMGNFTNWVFFSENQSPFRKNLDPLDCFCNTDCRFIAGSLIDLTACVTQAVALLQDHCFR